MDKFQTGEHQIRQIDRYHMEKKPGAGIHPAARLFVVVVFLICVMSCPAGRLDILCGLAVFPVVTALWEEISLWQAICHFRVVLVFLVFVGLFNPWQAMIGILVKGIWAVCATWLLMSMLGIRGICAAMRWFHLPSILVTTVGLIYRYSTLWMREMQQMSQAYALRAPGKRGIAFRHWGSFLGLLLLRSVDRSREVYQAMLLRGYDPEHQMAIPAEKPEGTRSLAYVAIWSVVLLAVRILFLHAAWVG